MARATRLAVLSPALALAAIIVGCGGGGTSIPPNITVSVSASAATAEAGSQVTITAQVNNDTSNKGVTWSMSPASGTGSGLLINPTGTSVTYKAPGAPPTNNVTVTITATSVVDGSKSGSATITPECHFGFDLGE